MTAPSRWRRSVTQRLVMRSSHSILRDSSEQYLSVNTPSSDIQVFDLEGN